MSLAFAPFWAGCLSSSCSQVTQKPPPCTDCSNGYFVATDGPSPEATPTEREDLTFNQEYLRVALASLTQAPVEIRPAEASLVGGCSPSGSPSIYLHRPNRSGSPNPFAVPAPAPGGQLPLEGFRIVITPCQVDVYSGDPRGQRYALDWLIPRLDPQAFRMAPAEFADAPAFHLRAVHLGNYSLDQMVTVLDDISRARFNTIEWEMKTEVDLDTLRPFRAQGANSLTSKAQVKAFLQEAAKRHIVVVPAVKFLTHQRALLAAADLIESIQQTYPGLLTLNEDEDDGVYNPRFTDSGGHSIYDALLLPLLDEVLALFSSSRFAPAVSIGHDEATRGALAAIAQSMGNVSPGRLFAEDVLKLHDFLEARGRSTLMWGDMLLDPREPELQGFKSFSLHGHWDNIGTEALGLLTMAGPRHLVIGDWQYWVQETRFMSNDYLAKSGLRVAGATWYWDDTTLNFARDELLLPAQRGQGMIATVWNPPQAYGQGNQHLMAYSGDVFWTGGAPSIAPNHWPNDAQLMLTTEQGRVTELFAPGDVVNVWVAARDAETPVDQLRGFELSLKSPTSSGLDKVDAGWSYVPEGPGFGFSEYRWRIQFPLALGAAKGRNVLKLVYTDAEGIPNITLHTNTLFVGRTSGPNLVINGGFEKPLTGPDGGWKAPQPPTGVSFTITEQVYRSGGAAAQVEVNPALCDGGCSFWHVRQNVDLSQVDGGSLYVRYWLKTEGRTEGQFSGIDLLLLDADGGTSVCWPDRKQADPACHLETLPGSKLTNQDWTSFGEVIAPPREARQLQLRIRQQNLIAPQGRSYFDDVEMHRLVK